MSELAKEIIPVNLEDEMRRSYLDYAMSVIVGRALPDVRDGLKPVHRRVLFAMNELGAHSNKPYYKSARIVGDVIGKYHPHGDNAVYDTLVRMAQPFSLRYLLVDGQGNFGSIDGDNAAAMRYTEARMSRISHELMADIDKDTVDFQPNYDEKELEPTVMPARVPNLLINGSAGIAVGMATNIPPHNLNEVVDALLALLDAPQIDIDGCCGKNTNAAKCALKMNWVVKEALVPQAKAKFSSLKEFDLTHCAGVSRSEVLVVRGGVRGNNDLVFVGSAPNIAAKLSEIRDGSYRSYIDRKVHQYLHESARYGGTEKKHMWIKTRRTIAGAEWELYKSHWQWTP